MLLLIFGIDDALVGAAAISAGASIASGIGNNLNNRSLANKQLQKNYELWKEQTTYNSPSAQVARLKSAGLNPALAYGGSSQVVGNADTTPNLDYSGAINTPMFGSDSAIQLGQTAAQMAKQFQVQDSQIEMQQAQALKLRADAASTDAFRDPTVQQILSQNELNLAKKNESYKSAELMQHQMDVLLTQKDLNIAETQGYQLANIYAAATMEFRVQAADLNNKEAMQRIKTNQALEKKYGADVVEILSAARLNEAKILNTESDTSLKNQEVYNARLNARVISATEQKIKALTKQIQVETGISEKDANWYTADKIMNYLGIASNSFGNISKGVSSMAMAGIL